MVRRDGACVNYGETLMLSAHHAIPRVEGGSDSPSNLETLCVACHGRETTTERRKRGYALRTRARIKTTSRTMTRSPMSP